MSEAARQNGREHRSRRRRRTMALRKGLKEFMECRDTATWRSGYAEVCKTFYPGSIPGVASNKINDFEHGEEGAEICRQCFGSVERIRKPAGVDAECAPPCKAAAASA